MELLVIAFSIALFVLALYDVMLSRRTGGDPTLPTDPNAPAITFNNPGFREPGRNGTYFNVFKTFQIFKKNDLSNLLKAASQ